MESLAEPGSTYVTGETFSLTEGLFKFIPMGKKKVKGKEKPISVFKLVYAKEGVYRPRLGFERIFYSEMVGRDKDLERLELQVKKAKNGDGSVVNIIGEAGIGKSRLVAELKKRDIINLATFLEGRAIATGKTLSFHPIIDLLKQWAQIKENDSAATAFGKLETAIRRTCQEDTDEVLPFVTILMGM